MKRRGLYSSGTAVVTFVICGSQHHSYSGIVRTGCRLRGEAAAFFNAPHRSRVFPFSSHNVFARGNHL